MQKKFRDKNGVVIKSGDILFRRFYARWRERPRGKRVALDMMGSDVIVPDEGKLLGAKEHWVTYKVGWSGACMVAERHEMSDFQALIDAELFDESGKRISEGSGFYYLNEVFDSTVYEVRNECY